MYDFTGPMALLLAAALGAALTFMVYRASFTRRHAEARDRHEATLARAIRDGEEKLRVVREEAEREHAFELHKAKAEYELALLHTQHDMKASQAVAEREAEEKFVARLKEQSQSALSVTVHPFVNTSRQRSLFAKETLIEVGYKYQLLIQGLPCFEPHTVIVETTKEKDVNDETIELLKTKAVQLAELAANTKSGGAASTIFSIAKAAVQRMK